MPAFKITPEFFSLFPDTKIVAVTAHGIDNTQASSPAIIDMLKRANGASEKFTTESPFSENPAVASWREAYKKFKTKKGVRSSIENLLKRVSKGKDVGSINPLVDIYNTISLRFGLPCGGEDIDTFVGDMLLTLADGGEEFIALGEETSDDALPGEVVYKDEQGAICRCWNWRDGQRTMLTEDTKNAVLVIESVDPSFNENLLEAGKTLGELISEHLGGDVTVQVLDIDNPEIQL